MYRNCFAPPFPTALDLLCISGPACGLGQQGWNAACPDPVVDRGALVALFAGAGGPSWNRNGWNGTSNYCGSVTRQWEPLLRLLLLLLLLLLFMPLRP